MRYRFEVKTNWHNFLFEMIFWIVLSGITFGLLAPLAFWRAFVIMVQSVTIISEKNEDAGK